MFFLTPPSNGSPLFEPFILENSTFMFVVSLFSSKTPYFVTHALTL